MRSPKKRLFIGRRLTKAVILPAILLGLFPGHFVPESDAAFTLNWQQDYSAEGATFVDNDAYFCGGFSYMSCSVGGGGWGGSRGGGGSNDNSAFLQESLQIGGQTYFHLIVGDYTKDTVATEVFIHVSGGNNSRSGITFSDSLCNNCIESRSFNAADALNSNSNLNGNGGGNPNSVIMHQIIQDGTIQGEFLKDSFNKKPLISQTITTPDIKSTMSMDLRGKTYTDNTPVALSSVILTNTLLGTDRNGATGDFNIQTQGKTVNLTAGAFTYTPTALGSGTVGTGGGWGGSRDSGSTSGASGGGGGTYAYADPFTGDSFQPLNYNYAQFCDPAQNSGVTSGSSGWGGFRSGSSSNNCGGVGSSSGGGGGW